VSSLQIAALSDGCGFRLAGDLDFSTLPSFTAAVRTFSPNDELHLDLANLIHVDSAGLHAILGIARSRRDRSLVLVNPSATVTRSFEIAAIDQHPAIEIRHGEGSSAPRHAGGRATPLQRAG
jgi:anti-anti-sigma factor